MKRTLYHYVAWHGAIMLLTFTSFLFTLGNFSVDHVQGKEVLAVWNKWDVGQFSAIAAKGYTGAWQTAFFPLYPTLEGLMRPLDPFIAGLIISNLATLGIVIVFYLLMQKEGKNIVYSKRMALIVLSYPTSIFFFTAYNESLFLFLVLLCFYCMKTDHFWIAALCGYLAALTRSAGILLIIPYCYMCWQKRRMPWGSLIILGGTAFFALCCYNRFGDPLAFSHAQSVWHRTLSFPWQGIVSGLAITGESKISFDGLHNALDALLALALLPFIILCFFRLPRVYALYAVAVYVFLLLFPSADRYPLQSFSRLSIELFPVFMVVNELCFEEYLLVSLPLFAFYGLQFTTGHWTV